MQQSLSLEEIRTLVLKQLRFDQLYTKRMCEGFLTTSAHDSVESEPNNQEVERALLESMADVVAVRLFEGDTSKPLMDEGDSDTIIRKIVDSLAAASGAKEDEEIVKLAADDDPNGGLIRELSSMVAHIVLALEEERKAALAQALSGMVKNIVRTAKEDAENSPENRHAAFWEWVRIVTSNAADHQISIDEFLSREDAYDVITRQQYSREQFAQRTARALKKYDIEKYTRAMIEPVLEQIKDPEEREEQRRIGTSEIRASMLKTLEFMDGFYKAETLRIYGER